MTGTVTATSAPLLEVIGLAKSYGSFQALTPTDITIRKGSVHGFLGKNGAGKSTLVKMIAGSVQPTSGRILFQGQDITHLPLARRRELGINLLPQHAEVVSDLSVAENIVMPDYPTSGGLLDKRAMHRQARQILDRYQLTFDVDAPAGSLSVPDQRRLSIVRTLREDGALAMLDEPTTALSHRERQALFRWIRDLNAEGQTFTFISHFSNEVQAVCDECSVLRDGRLISTGQNPSTMTPAEISTLVTGGAIDEFHRDRQTGAEPRISLQSFTPRGQQPIDLTIGGGEIVGFVGLPGSGAREAVRAMAGLHPVAGGLLSIDGRQVDTRSVRTAMRSGVTYLTDDRIGEGIVGPFSVLESIVTGAWPARSGFVDRGKVRSIYNAQHARLSFRVSGPEQPIEELSGGNQQKILIGRLLALEPKLLILDEPTIGVDVKTKDEVHRLVDELSRRGTTVILLAYDTDEMVRMVDRVVAFQDGYVARELTGDQITPDDIVACLHHESESNETPTERAV